MSNDDFYAERVGNIEVDEDSDGWQDVEVDMSDNNYTCLVCSDILKTPTTFFKHLTLKHNFVNFLDGEGVSMFKDQYNWIRFVNFVRKNAFQDLGQAIFDLSWKGDSTELLRPVLIDDEVLAIDIEAYLNIDSDQSKKLINNCLSNLDSNKMSQLVEENKVIHAKLMNCKHLLSCMADQPLSLKLAKSSITHSNSGSVVRGSKNEHLKSVGNGYDHHDDDDDEEEDIDDSAYFGSYGHFEIHGEMINDHIRTNSYRDFMLANSDHYFSGKYVLDVGSGSGILSMFAAQAGAKHVYGVEASMEIYAASQESIRINNLENQITLLRDRVETVSLPVDKVDIIISEWMGYFLFFESMLDSVLKVASRYLAPNGHIFPRHYGLYIMGVQCSSTLRQRHLDHWSSVYGFQMPALRRAALHEVHIVNLTQQSSMMDREHLVSDHKPVRILTCPIEVMALDLELMHEKGIMQQTQDGSVICDQDFMFIIDPEQHGTMSNDHCVLDAIVGYFDVRFDDNAPKQISFSTSPTSPLTHWKQTLFFLDKPINVRSGDRIRGNMCVKRSKQDIRGLDIHLTLEFENDFAPFNSSKFNHVQWINDLFQVSKIDANADLYRDDFKAYPTCIVDTSG